MWQQAEPSNDGPPTEVVQVNPTLLEPVPAATIIQANPTTLPFLEPVPAATSGALMPAQGFMAPFKLATMTPADMASLAVFMVSAQAAQAAPRQYRPDYGLTPANASIILLSCLLTSLIRKLCPRLPGRGMEGWTCSYLRTV